VDDHATHPIVAASDDMRYLFVLADGCVGDRASAIAALLDGTRVEWRCRVDPTKLPAPVRLWFKQDGEQLVWCRAADSEADSRWWVFADVPADAIERLPDPDTHLTHINTRQTCRQRRSASYWNPEKLQSTGPCRTLADSQPLSHGGNPGSNPGSGTARTRGLYPGFGA
jgi:hypothetical protein